MTRTHLNTVILLLLCAIFLPTHHTEAMTTGAVKHFFQKSHRKDLSPMAIAERIESRVLAKRMARHPNAVEPEASPWDYIGMAGIMLGIAAAGSLIIAMAFLLAYCGTNCYEVSPAFVAIGVVVALFGLIFMGVFIAKAVKAFRKKRHNWPHTQ